MIVEQGTHVHFMGIGGVGMSAAAQLTLEQEAVVSGCDLQSNKYTRALEEKGCTVYTSHDERHIDDADIVVYSSAISPGNPELVQAADKGIPVYKRAIYTILLMKEKRLIGISGSHGKTTTTWMTAHVFINAGKEPSLMVGGTVPEIYGNFRIGNGEWFISEVDESDGTITETAPEIAVITNIDREHMRYYRTLDELKKAFRAFLEFLPPEGFAVICGDDPACLEVADGLKCNVITYGISPSCDVRAENLRSRDLNMVFDLHYEGEIYRDIQLLFSGEHNISNSLASFCVAVSQGIPVDEIIRGLETCRPVKRRFEMSGSLDDVLLVNDYAHHPTEIGAVMRTAEEHLKDFRKIYVFQPHRYTRLRDCWEEFISVFTTTNILIVLPVYSANEEPIEGISSHHFIRELAKRNIKAELVKKDLVCRHLETIVRPGDCVLFLGAGDIGEVYSECTGKLVK